MSVIIRPKRKPVNRLFLAAAGAAGTFWELWPTPDSAWQTDACAWMALFAAVFCLWRGGRVLSDDYHLR